MVSTNVVRTGNCSEVEMMKELAANGPIAVGIEPGAGFEEYRAGIYIEPPEDRRARLPNTPVHLFFK